jgi:hypothetical protein
VPKVFLASKTLGANTIFITLGGTCGKVFSVEVFAHKNFNRERRNPDCHGFWGGFGNGEWGMGNGEWFIKDLTYCFYS